MNTTANKHTPGPWSVDARGLTRCGGPRIEAQGGRIAIADAWGQDTLEQQNANAALIAASPELLDKLKDVGELLVSLAVEHPELKAKLLPYMNELDELEAKAEGRS